MKQIIFTIPLLFLGLISFAQTTKSDGILSKYALEVQKIIKSDSGIVRGYNFGTPVTDIKKSETARYMADGRDFAIFKVPINDKEEAEIIYYLDDQDKVKGFGIAFLVNVNATTEETLIDDFQNYFNERYGKFKVNDKNDEYWTAKDGSYTVEMGDSSESSDLLEIEIEIFKK